MERDHWYPAYGILLLTFLLDTSDGQWTLSTPRHISIQEGLCFYLPCTFTTDPKLTPSLKAIGQWKKYINQKDQPVFTSQDQSAIPINYKDRIFFTGNANKLDCSMSINAAQSSDSGSYFYRTQDSNTASYSYNDYMIDLKVTALTEKPVVTVGERQEVDLEVTLGEGEEVTLVCKSPGKCAGPAPVITWSGWVEGKTFTYTTSYPDRNKTFHSNITFTPSKEDNQTSLTCTVTFPNSLATTSKSIYLNIRALTEKPVVTTGENQEVDLEVTLVEGEQSTLTCISPGRCAGPAPVITWSGRVEGTNVTYITSYPDGNKTFYSNIIFTPSKEDNQSSLTCTVTFPNSLATTSKSISLNVEYPPVTIVVEDTRNGQWILSSPRQISVEEGLCIYLPCTFTTDPKNTPTSEAIGMWKKVVTGEPVFTSQDQSEIPINNRDRIFFTGDANKLDCSMSINAAQRSDSGSYFYRTDDRGHSKNSYSYSKYKIDLMVNTLTTKPVVTVRENLEVDTEVTLMDGEEVTLSCKSPGRCAGPTPVITWTGRVEGMNFTYITSYPDWNKTLHSNITFTPSKQDNQSPLTCTVTFPNSLATTSKSIFLNVEYPPVVNMTVEGFREKNITVIEGDSKMFICIVESNPQAIVILYHGNMILNQSLNGGVLSYELKDAKPSDTGMYRCSANNTHGTNDSVIKIIVDYYPRAVKISCSSDKDCVIDGNNTIYVPEESQLSLVCSAESVPPSVFSWIKSNWCIIHNSRTGALAVDSVSFRDEGLYTCEASNKHGRSNKSVMVIMTYKPRSLPGTSGCQKIPGTLECTCVIQAFPEATVLWKVDGLSYASFYNNTDLLIVTATSKSVKNSSLVTKWMHIQSVECISFNKKGDLTLPLLSNQPISPGTDSSAIIITGTVCGVIIITIIGGVLLTKYCRNRKLSPKTEDNEVNADCDHIDNIPKVPEETMNLEKTPERLVRVEESPDLMCDYVHYATLDFSKLKPKVPVEEHETQYACIRPINTIDSVNRDETYLQMFHIVTEEATEM